jgi:hypothetical protein
VLPLLLAMPVHSTASAGRQRAARTGCPRCDPRAGAADETFNASVRPRAIAVAAAPRPCEAVWNRPGSSLRHACALVAQLDRAPDFESGGRGFESLRARHRINGLAEACRFEIGHRLMLG